MKQETPLQTLKQNETIYNIPINTYQFLHIMKIETKEINAIKVLDAIKIKFPKNIMQKILNIFIGSNQISK